MSDVKLFNTPDGGDITIEFGEVALSGGLETAAYLSLFGGNESDSTRQDDPDTWWGNLSENEPARRYRSQTQHLLNRLPAVPFNLRRIEGAVERDLAWMTDQSIASSIEVSATIPGLNQVRIVIDIEARGERSRFEFTENWEASA
jgi:phage gp46-like protein